MATYRRGEALDATTCVRGIRTLHAYARAPADLIGTYDAPLLSTLGGPAIPIGWISEPPQPIGERPFAFMPNTQVFHNIG